LIKEKKKKKMKFQIKAEAVNLIQKSDDECKKLNKLKACQNEGLEKVMVDWFAMTQEISFRTIGLRHFETQLMAGYYLHQGKIVEMKTGEGPSTLPVSLNALSKEGVHVVTVNDYLAERPKNGWSIKA
jgi:preprotein translocase subunit SecA